MLNLSLAIYLTKLSSGKYKNYFSNVFGNNHRIYFPLSDDGIIYDFSTKDKVVEVIESMGYNVTDYIGGYATDGKQKFKIGKLLAKSDSNSSLLESFKLDPMRSNNDKLNIVISRHPYDIGGMSTNRSWDSCMRLSQNYNSDEEGCNAHFVKSDIMSGTLIAYLVKKEDKNINEPMSRLLIKPLFSRKGDILMNVSNRIYGLKSEPFKNTLIKLVDSLFNKNAKETIYYRDYHLHYNDDGDVKSIDNRSEETKRKDMERAKLRFEIIKKKEFTKFFEYFSNNFDITSKTDIINFSDAADMKAWSDPNFNKSLDNYYSTLQFGGRYLVDWIVDNFDCKDHDFYRLMTSSRIGYDTYSAILENIKSDRIFARLSDHAFKSNKKDGYYGYYSEKLVDRIIDYLTKINPRRLSDTNCDRLFSYVFSNTLERVTKYEEFLVDFYETNPSVTPALVYYYMGYDVDRISESKPDNLFKELKTLYYKY